MVLASRQFALATLQTRIPLKVGHARWQWAVFDSTLQPRAGLEGKTKRCRVVSGAAGNWEDWLESQPYTTSHYPDVSLLTQTEKVLFHHPLLACFLAEF